MSKPRTRLFSLLQIAFTLVMVVTLATGGIAFAQATTKSLSTNYTLVNLGAAEAHASATYYKEDGTVWPASQTSFTLPPNGGQAIVRQYEDTMAAGSGSAVISADQPLGSVVQILARNQTATSGAYVGSSNTASTYYVPLVLRQRSGASGVSSSQIIVQNADLTDANVTVTLNTLPGSAGSGAYVATFTVKPGASKYLDLVTGTFTPALPAEWYGSAVVSGGGKMLAVVSNLFAGANSLQTFNAFPDNRLTNSWFVPLFTSRLANALSTPVTVQNLSGADMTAGQIQIVCTKDPALSAAGTTDFSVSNSAPVPNNQSYAINPVTDTSIQAGWVGSCKVNAPSGRNVAVFVQMRQPGYNENTGAYEAIPANGTNKHMLVPLVAKRLGNGFATAVTIQNLGAAAATVNLHYVPSAESSSATPVDVNGLVIPPGGSLVRNHRLEGAVPGAEPTLPVGFVGTLVVTSVGTTPQAIDGFVQLTNVNPTAGDTFMAHAVFTQP